MPHAHRTIYYQFQMADEAIRSKRSMLYASFYAKYEDLEELRRTTPPGTYAENPFNLDNIGDGYGMLRSRNSKSVFRVDILECAKHFYSSENLNHLIDDFPSLT